ncbi:L domain-like protein [Karstenula rhodostoma CBS 690.94]|uniref:L domain-like protein n=1 Tax=Karstenula rhodostoma CBS 690.94 TaxID=1392251 RepID=A0A9P4PHQ0_9PLEO|nr:L domain-like protein [Karstenula rhodostoma CBS 690.94]
MRALLSNCRIAELLLTIQIISRLQAPPPCLFPVVGHGSFPSCVNNTRRHVTRPSTTTMEQPSGMPRPSSGIPRLSSRLPVLRPAGSQSQLRSTPSTEQLRKKPSLSALSRDSQPPRLQKKPSQSAISRVGQSPLQKKPSLSSVPRTSQPLLQKKPSVSSISRISQPPPSLQKKLSRTSLARPSIAPPAPANTTSNRPSVLSTKRSVPSLAGRNAAPDASVFKKPTGRPSSRQTRARVQPTKLSNGAQNDDVLGDLDAFRSASRASSRASSRAGFRDTEPQYALDVDEDALGPVVRKSRPSLSDRTIESLSQLPPSPAGSRGRRRSSFFNDGDSMGPPPRPASALSNGRRPTTSDGTLRAVPATPQRGALAFQQGSMTAPRSASDSMTGTSGTPSKLSSIARPPSMVKKPPLSQVQNLQSTPNVRPLSNSKTMVARTPKSQTSMAGTYGQAISPPATTPVSTTAAAKKTPGTARKTVNSSAALREQLAKAKAAKGSEITNSADATSSKPSSSQSLRDQIAKAKAAKRANVTSPPRPRTNTPPRDAIIPDPVEIASFDFGLDDPFNQRPKGASLLRKRVDAARADGRLNLAAMDLSEIPEEVLNMYEYNPEVNTAWGEVVDLTSMIVADNNLQLLPDSMFPDVDYEAAMDMEDVVPQFGGILNLDLHGNAFRELPLGLGRLPQLSKLNLSRNKLTTDSLTVVFQIATLRELKLAENELTGALPAQIENLTSLETLDLQANRLSSLPPEIRALTHLKVLNIADNKFTSLPSDVFTSMPVIDLNASKNSFSGTFFEVETVPNLQTLTLANNLLTSLCGSDTVLLPSMKHLDLSMNRLSNLPNMADWTSLVTLLAGENSLSTFPEGFCSLKQLRNADFTANNINKMDEQIAFMECLENLTLAANPLRERKYMTMNAEDIKHDLMSKLDPGIVPEGDLLQDLANGEELETENNGWKLTPSGALDLSSQNMTEVDGDALASFAESHNVKQLHLQQNSLTILPMAIAQLSFLTVLDLSKNNMVDPLSESLELPKLRELRLASNKLKSFHAITSMLSAPSLHHLDVSNNKIAGSLPNVRESYPGLLTLLASDNGIDEVSAESLEGLKIVSLGNNEIARLDPYIGLLAGTLTSLEVEGNKFRVPGYAVLKKGTDAVLAWLKDKVPAATDEFDPGSPVF